MNIHNPNSERMRSGYEAEVEKVKGGWGAAKRAKWQEISSLTLAVHHKVYHSGPGWKENCEPEQYLEGDLM